MTRTRIRTAAATSSPWARHPCTVPRRATRSVAVAVVVVEVEGLLPTLAKVPCPRLNAERRWRKRRAAEQTHTPKRRYTLEHVSRVPPPATLSVVQGIGLRSLPAVNLRWLTTDRHDHSGRGVPACTPVPCAALQKVLGHGEAGAPRIALTVTSARYTMLSAKAQAATVAAEADVSSESKWAEELQTLADMGFADTASNERLLELHDGALPLVIADVVVGLPPNKSVSCVLPMALS